MRIPKRKIKHISINFSTLSQWDTCNAKAYFAQLLRRQAKSLPKTESLSRDVGTCVHAALEAHYKGLDVAEAIDKAHTQLGLPSQGKGCIAHIDLMVEDYLLKIKEYKPFLVEKTLEVEITDQISFRGTVDLVVERGDELMLVDHKTTSDLTRYLKPKVPFSYQFSMYLYILQNLYENVSNEFLVHGLQTNPKRTRTVEYKGKRTKGELAELKDWAIGRTNQIIRAFEYGVIHPSLGDACVMYNKVCEFAPICTNSKEYEKVLDKDYKTLEEYHGFSIEWED